MTQLTELKVPTHFPQCRDCASRSTQLSRLLQSLKDPRTLDHVESNTSCEPGDNKSLMSLALTIYRSALTAEVKSGRISAFGAQKLSNQSKSSRRIVDCPGLLAQKLK